ncbi:ketopantoate reductase PanE/ApbA C terminal-domain-containing protein [Aspergillus carlsbadensis]|nr:ketopantoate reductase PanE/ApbA C terminal-domain-containing protein [Aspergillus carlsbadensis]
MFGVRPLLRTAAPELCGARGSGFQKNFSSRLASTWAQDFGEFSGNYGNRRLSGRIHVLGLGNVGTFVAHSLKSRPSPPPITLMMHNTLMFSSWLARKKCLAINTNGLDDIKTGFDVNIFHNQKWCSAAEYDELEFKPGTDWAAVAEDNEEIECLIVTVKAPVTSMALEGVRHRLTPNSTVLFLQNGMGIIDEVNAKVFPDPSRRPHYMVGITSHGLAQRNDSFHVSHNGVGTTVLGPVPQQNSPSLSSNDTEPDWAPSTKYLLRTLTLTPPLVAVAEPPSSILMYQLEKLAMNSIINPLTVLMDCNNGELLYNFSVTRLMRLLLFEISGVICSLPELQGIPGIESRFSPERLRGMATQLMHKTAKNTSSMLQDIRGRRSTEIEYLNGYIVRRGEELGIKCVVNYTIKHLVLAKQLDLRQRESHAIPIDVMKDLERRES